MDLAAPQTSAGQEIGEGKCHGFMKGLGWPFPSNNQSESEEDFY